MQLDFYEIGTINEKELRFAVISAVYQNKWVYVRHKERKTWEIPGGHRDLGEDIMKTAKRELFEEPNLGKLNSGVKDKYSAWSFRHLVLGVVAIFFYVGVEVGIPGELNFYLTDDPMCGAAIGGAVAAIYWLLMMVGRACSTAISGKVSTKIQLSVVAVVAILFVVVAIVLPQDIRVSMPGYSVAGGFSMFQVPLSALFLVLCGLCTSLMWGCIFNLSVEGLGKYTEQASGIFMMMVVGGGVMPLIQNAIGKSVGYMASYWIVVAMLLYILFYALVGSKNVNTDIPVE